MEYPDKKQLRQAIHADGGTFDNSMLYFRRPVTDGPRKERPARHDTDSEQLPYYSLSEILAEEAKRLEALQECITRLKQSAAVPADMVKPLMDELLEKTRNIPRQPNMVQPSFEKLDRLSKVNYL